MKVIQVAKPGGPEALQYVDVPVPSPKAGEVLVRQTAVGVNFIDVYHREGRYPLPLPFVPGSEAAGVVEAVGEGVSEFRPGQRVAYAMHVGSYAEYAAVPAAKLVPVPDAVDDRSAAAAMLQGMTAHYLCRSTYPVHPGDTVLVHAGAGGVGLLLTQMVRRIGARVITTVSTPEKAELSRQAGADEVILYTGQDFEAETMRLTNGAGVQVVYDSVGRTTFDKSMTCLAPRGHLVLYGASSGPVPPFDPIVLGKKSLFLTRPSLAHYTLTRDELLLRANDVLQAVQSGELKLRIEHVYPLAEAAQAHRDLEGRATTGKLLLVL
ncbi:MAG: quinone oxidoreductase [Cytophagales bacterium]|nr:quinone oxidoreductase [Cytophagales bacterium]